MALFYACCGIPGSAFAGPCTNPQTNSSAAFFDDPSEGLSESNPVRIYHWGTAVGRQDLEVATGRSCYVSFQVDYLAEIQLKISIEKSSDHISPMLTEKDSRASFAGQATQDGAATYKLPYGQYVFMLKNTSAALRKYAVSLVVLKNDEAVDVKAEPGFSASFKLGRGSKSAWLALKLDRRSRIGLTFSPSKGAHWLYNQSPTISFTDAKSRRFQADYVNRASATTVISCEILLDPGTYEVEIESNSNSFPLPEVTPKEAAFFYTVEVKASVATPLDPRLRLLQTWFADVKLDDLFEVLQLVDYTDLTAASDEDAEILSSVFVERKLHRLAHMPDVHRPDVPDISQLPLNKSTAWLKANNAPRYVLRLRLHMDKDKLGLLEDSFYESTKMSLWEKIIEKISLQTDISAHDIVSYGHVYCTDGTAAEILPGLFTRIGFTCMSGSFGIEIPDAFKKLVATAGDIPTDQAPATFLDSVHAFLDKRFKSTAARIKYLTDEDLHVQVIVRGLRGEIVKGSQMWERGEIVLSLTDSKIPNNRRLQVNVDGLMASGLGGYPADTDFTKPMETEYHAALDEYAADIGRDFKAFVTHKDRP